ncbi:hypothetical protein M434DRAFT_194620 [Hypoxylon sp. CO27-5]|nr:hypothetical protein M434DRAFT_194620 [Hypoxylon sp. CO27-5]
MSLQGPIFEVRPHVPKKRWDRHGIPVEIDLEDDRGIATGALHLDVPDESISYPCYALFLDPSKALILRTKDLEPKRNADDTEDPNDLVSKPIPTSLFNVVRIGVGVFVKASKENPDEKPGEEKEPEQWDEAKHGKLTLDKILHVSGDGSWGPITTDDPIVCSISHTKEVL